jgi:hypothetical protein
MRKTIFCTLLGIFAFGSAVSAQDMKPEMLAEFEQKTGLKPVEIPDTRGSYMGKTHRGYQVFFTAKAGNVWGRYVARLTAAELGKEAGGFWARITGHRDSITDTVVGSPVDKMLNRYFGYPITLAIVLIHDKPGAPRLDIKSDKATVEPGYEMTRRSKIGGNAGYVYSDDAGFAATIAGNAPLMKRLKNLRDQHITVDNNAVTFLFAGTELDYSSLIRNHGDYYKMLNDLTDDLADIADAIPAERQPGKAR